MKCSTCQFTIKPDLVFCIQNNFCPKCGKEIMNAGRLENYLYLIKDIKSNVSLTDDEAFNASVVERIALYLLEYYDFKKLIRDDAKDSLRKKLASQRDIQVDEGIEEYEEEVPAEEQEMLKASISFDSEPGGVMRRQLVKAKPINRLSD